MHDPILLPLNPTAGPSGVGAGLGAHRQASVDDPVARERGGQAVFAPATHQRMASAVFVMMAALPLMRAAPAASLSGKGGGGSLGEGLTPPILQ